MYTYHFCFAFVSYWKSGEILIKNIEKSSCVIVGIIILHMYIYYMNVKINNYNFCSVQKGDFIKSTFLYHKEKEFKKNVWGKKKQFIWS